MQEDAYGLPLSTSSDAAAEHYRLAVDRLLSGTGQALPVAQAAIDADPGFALAYSARANAQFLAGQPREARSSAEQAVALAAAASRRERQHAQIVLEVLSGRRDSALACIREHMAEFPRDALAVDPAAGVFGLIGFSGRPDREAEQVAFLEPLARHYGEDWWYQSVLGFALAEHDQVDRALDLVASSIEQKPDSGHVAHTWVHALFEAGAHDRARAWLADWLPAYAPDGILYCHLWWHLALFHLGQRDFDAMWAAYDAHCQEGQSASPAINLFTDGVALAWRARVAGADVPRDWLESLRALGERHFPRPGIFVDVHRAIVLAALGDTDELAAFRRDRREALEAGHLAAGEVVLTLTEGFEAFANRDYGRAAALLADAESETVRIGGSRAQRRIVTETREAAEALRRG